MVGRRVAAHAGEICKSHGDNRRAAEIRKRKGKTMRDACQLNAKKSSIASSIAMAGRCKKEKLKVEQKGRVDDFGTLLPPRPIFMIDGGSPSPLSLCERYNGGWAERGFFALMLV